VQAENSGPKQVPVQHGVASSQGSPLSPHADCVGAQEPSSQLPEQHCVPVVHVPPPSGMHATQVDSQHEPPQHGMSSLHALPFWAHDCGAPHVPLVAPGGTLQTPPEQQSPSTVQAPPLPTHGETQAPSTQVPEQHCAPEVHAAAPLGMQATHFAPTHSVLQQSSPSPQEAPTSLHPPVGTPHRNSSPCSRHELGAQHPSSFDPSHAAPWGLQEETAVQWRTPPASGTHGAPLQH
jgi:hypothetical protein